MPEKHSDIDLTEMSKEQVLVGMWDLLMGMLISNKVAIAAMSEEGKVTFINPLIIASLVPPETLASELLDSWSEEEVEKILEHIYE